MSKLSMTPSAKTKQEIRRVTTMFKDANAALVKLRKSLNDTKSWDIKFDGKAAKLGVK